MGAFRDGRKIKDFTREHVNQTRICLFESHTHGLQSSIVATNSAGNNSDFITISWKDGYARQGGSLEGSNVTV